MSAGHASRTLYRHRNTWLHRLSAKRKILLACLFALVVVATPRSWFTAFALYAAIVGSCLVVARVRPGDFARRMMIELPFVAFAVLIVFIATGPRTTVWGVEVSEAGLWAAWGLLSKATLAISAAIVLAATTSPPALVLALRDLGLPRELTQIMMFMLRYLHVISDESHRMSIARQSRGFEPRSWRSWSTLSRALSALFIRSYERGERVHLAMLSRGSGRDL